MTRKCIISAIAMFVNPNNPNADLETRNMQEAALTSARELHIIKVSTTSEIDAGFATLVQQHIGALLVGTEVTGQVDPTGQPRLGIGEGRERRTVQIGRHRRVDGLNGQRVPGIE